MPLSEHEQRLLEQMERALHAEDPKFASTLRRGSQRTVNGRQVFLGVLGVVLGLVALVSGVSTSIIALGAAGFLLMLGGVLLISAGMRAQPENGFDAAVRVPGSPPKQTEQSSFMARMEERWRRRRENDGFTS